MTLVKKLAYQSWHRGTRENDLILGSFADAVLPDLCKKDLTAYKALLDQDDSDLFAWITGQKPVPENHYLIHRIREFLKCS